MTLPDIDFGRISRFRGELMGAAMLFVVLFHVSVGRSDMFFGLHRLGNLGVDIFLFLSGMGLWFAWTKHPSLRRFFSRRYLRVYPSWLVVACLFYVPDFFGSQKFSSSLPDLVGDVALNWGFWKDDELTFWYVPAVMMLYTFAPAYIVLVRRWPVYRWLPVLMVVWCVMVEWVGPVHSAVGHIEIFWSRVPIFFIGINCGTLVMNRRSLGREAWPLVLGAFAMAFATCLYLEQVLHGRFPLFVERMVYIPLCLTAVLLMSVLMAVLPSRVRSSLRFVGTVSLEVYLLHAHFVLWRVESLGLGYWPTFLITVAATLPVAWLLHRVTAPLERLVR